MNNKKTIFIVGGAGYVGEMLCERWGERSDVEKIITLDKEPQSDHSKQLPKLIYLHHNMADDGWQVEVAKYKPDTVVHTAWQIRAMYGQARKQWRFNVDGSNKVFDFVFTEPSVKRLIYFSTAASYSARVDNSFDHLFTEAEPLRDDNYRYAHEKKVTEENLRQKYDTSKTGGQPLPQVTVLRPAAITGPRGRFGRIRFGLQSALQGSLKGGLLNRLITLLTTFVPAPRGFVRQFIHEDDVFEIVSRCIFTPGDWNYEVFNLTSVSSPVYATDLARAVCKRIVPVRPELVRLAYWFFWHATRGRIPTAPGSWRFYSYPILMDGHKLQDFYQCQHTSRDAFQFTDGYYQACVPDRYCRWRQDDCNSDTR